MEINNFVFQNWKDQSTPSVAFQQLSNLTINGFTVKNYTASDAVNLPALYFENREMASININK